MCCFMKASPHKIQVNFIWSHSFFSIFSLFLNDAELIRVANEICKNFRNQFAYDNGKIWRTRLEKNCMHRISFKNQMKINRASLNGAEQRKNWCALYVEFMKVCKTINALQNRNIEAKRTPTYPAIVQPIFPFPWEFTGGWSTVTLFLFKGMMNEKNKGSDSSQIEFWESEREKLEIKLAKLMTL
jgi:hypothetical protein